MPRNLKTLTQREAELNCQSALYSIGIGFDKKRIGIEDIGDYIPGSVMLQDLGNMINIYMNRYGCDILHKEREELAEMGAAYFDAFFPREELAVLKPELAAFARNNDADLIFRGC